MRSLASLLSSPTAATVRATMVSGLVALGIRADLWKQGGTASTILTIVAKTLAGFAATLTAAIQAGFLGSATGPWLVLLAYYVFGVTATPATYAAGNLTLTNAGGGIYSRGAGTVTAQNPTNGQTYVNSAPFTLGAMSSVSVPFQAQTPGSIGSSGVSAITVLVTSLLGVTVTNPIPFVGQDADTDAELVVKCQNARSARSALGPKGAYEAAVKGALNSSGNPVNINRIDVVIISDMAVVVYCASPAGPPTADDLNAARAAVLKLAQPMNVFAQVVAAGTVTDARVFTAWCQSVGVAATVAAAAQAGMLAAYAFYPISGLKIPPSTQGYLFGSFVEGVIQAADPSVFDVQGTSDFAIPDGDVVVWAGTINVRVLASS